MLKIQNQPIIRAAFNVALFNINNTNCNKHYRSKYKPLVSTTIETNSNDKNLVCNFKNNMIYAVYDDNAVLLKTKNDISITLKKDFESFRDAVDYFTRVIHHKIFK